LITFGKIALESVIDCTLSTNILSRGYSTAYFYRSVISSNTQGSCIAAQGRVAGTVSGYVFDECKVTYKQSTYGNTFASTYLGRPYSNYSTVLYKNSFCK
jgi:hypothetical protein